MTETVVVLPDEILSRVNGVVHASRETMARLPAGEELLPMAHIYTGDKLLLMATMFKNDHEKDLVAEAIRRTCRGTDADLLVLRIESWTVKLGPGEYDQFNREREAGKWRRLSSHPRAIEIVMFGVETRDDVWTGSGQIVRAADGTRTIGPIEWWHGAGEGRFVNLLCQRRVVH